MIFRADDCLARLDVAVPHSVGVPAELFHISAQRPTCIFAGLHGVPLGGSPQRPEEPKRVQPSRHTDLKRENKPW